MRLKDKVKKSDNKEKAYNYLISKGLSPHIAAGAVANLQQESNLDINAYNPDDLGKPSTGLAQWRGERKKQFEQFVGKDNSLEKQLDFVVWELNNTESRAFEKLRETSTPEEAALTFSKYYERPHKDYAHNDKRVLYANQVYQQYGDNQIYSTDAYGNTVNVNPNLAVKKDVEDSDTHKEMFYTENNLPLTNFDTPQETPIFVEETTTQTEEINSNNKEEEVKNPWQERLEKKMREREQLIGFINQGGIDYQAPEYNRPNVAQQIQKGYMQDGGKVLTSERGLYDHPDAESILVPTKDGRITMKGIGFPVLGIADTGEEILMQPEKEYHFKGAKTVLEIPQRNG